MNLTAILNPEDEKFKATRFVEKDRPQADYKALYAAMFNSTSKTPQSPKIHDEHMILEPSRYHKDKKLKTAGIIEKGNFPPKSPALDPPSVRTVAYPDITPPTNTTVSERELKFLTQAPPMNPQWTKWEDDNPIPSKNANLHERQREYAAERREFYKKLLEEKEFAYLRDVDNIPFGYDPICLRIYKTPGLEITPETILVVYIHGGGLKVGETDSEDLTCRKIAMCKMQSNAGVVVYSIGYHLKPDHPVSEAVFDCREGFMGAVNTRPKNKVILVGSSSGGQLALHVSQSLPPGTCHAQLLRCPATSDAYKGRTYVPEMLQSLHHSALETSFHNSLLGVLQRDVPRDGLERMPLEATDEELRSQPPTFIQVCTNDSLYSDGVCYAKLLMDKSVETYVHVVDGFPHTFWLNAPELPAAKDADEVFLSALAYLASLPKNSKGENKGEAENKGEPENRAKAENKGESENRDNIKPKG